MYESIKLVIAVTITQVQDNQEQVIVSNTSFTITDDGLWSAGSVKVASCGSSNSFF